VERPVQWAGSCLRNSLCSFALANPADSRYFSSRIDQGEPSFEIDEMNLTFGYNTNGFAHHKLEDALEIIADCGYRGVALTLDNYHCNPFTFEPADLNRLRQLLEKLQFRVVIETSRITSSTRSATSIPR
jgi:hypothetical protein